MSDLIEELDLQNFMGDQWPGMSERVQFFISYASEIVRKRAPRFDQISPILVKGVVCAMVARAIAYQDREPGVSEIEYPEVRTKYASGSDALIGQVYITDAELDLLTPPAELSGEAYSISTL